MSETGFDMTGGGGIEDVAILWLMRQAEGPLSAADAESFAEWLEEDPAHGAIFDGAVEAWQALGASRFEPEMLVLRSEALDIAQANQRQRWGVRFDWQPAAIAACLFALMMAGLATWWLMPQHYSTAIGERRVVMLEDGSRLTLDGHTSVKVRFNEAARRVILERGRATFVVAKDPLRPFSVSSNDNLVVATGTQFSVERLSRTTRVVLYEGRVAILHGNGASIRHEQPEKVRQGHELVSAEQLLKPGGELIMPEKGLIARIRQLPDPQAERAWEEGQIEVVDEPLGLVAERMNRYLPARQLEVSPDAVGTRVSGVFNAGDADAFVNGITSVFPIQAIEDGEAILLTHKK